MESDKLKFILSCIKDKKRGGYDYLINLFKDSIKDMQPPVAFTFIVKETNCDFLKYPSFYRALKYYGKTSTPIIKRDKDIQENKVTQVDSKDYSFTPPAYDKKKDNDLKFE